MFFYQIGDLSIDSIIPIPYLNKRSKSKKGRINITLSSYSFDEKFEDKRTIFSKDCIFYKSKTDSVYKISKNEISIYSAHADNLNELSRILIGLPLGYLLKLNGLNVLHGCCVSKGNKAACIIGKSGVGKSTMALGLINLGLDFVTEDLCVFENKRILGFSPWVKSSETNFTKSGIKSTQNLRIENDVRERIFYKIHDSKISNLAPLPKIFYFPIQNKKKSLTKIKKIEAFEKIFAYSYRIENEDSNELENITEIVKEVECYSFQRDINSPVEDNLSFLKEHMIKKLFS
tara:strand:- start:68 stop:934 length:867 start_codon:yes stop_codon:yes gene_type:complete